MRNTFLHSVYKYMTDYGLVATPTQILFIIVATIAFYNFIMRQYYL